MRRICESRKKVRRITPIAKTNQSSSSTSDQDFRYAPSTSSIPFFPDAGTECGIGFSGRVLSQEWLGGVETSRVPPARLRTYVTARRSLLIRLAVR
jgi:hypothetical protein